MNDDITNPPTPFDVEKSRVLDWILANLEASEGEERENWRYIKRVWEHYCMGGKF